MTQRLLALAHPPRGFSSSLSSVFCAVADRDGGLSERRRGPRSLGELDARFGAHLLGVVGVEIAQRTAMR
jgi:hypothetical protein